MNSLLQRLLVSMALGFVSAAALDVPAHSQSAPPPNQATWNLIVQPDPDTPPSRAGHIAIYDPIRKRMLVLGSNAPKDLWEMTTEGPPQWRHLDAIGDPLPEAGYLGIYDPVRDRMVLFTQGGDVWTLSLTETPSWHWLEPTGEAPFLHSGQSVIYDPVRDRIVLFGGRVYWPNQGPGETNAVWALRLAGTPSWELLAPANLDAYAPTPRTRHSAVYDPVRDRMIIFGGESQFYNFFDDTWAFSFSNPPGWRKVDALARPHWRYSHTAVYDPVDDRMLIFGGTTDQSGGGSYDETLALSLAGDPSWQTVPSLQRPLPRWGHSAVWDSNRSRMLVFGGMGYEVLNDCWGLSMADKSWSRLSPAWPDARPEPQFAWSASYDSRRGRMLLLGGGLSDPREIWSLPLTSGEAWSRLPVEGGPPSPWSNYRAVYDSRSDRLIAIGQKWFFADSMDDIWALSLAEPMTWSLLQASGSPPGRQNFRTAYDPEANAVVLYGGLTEGRDPEEIRGKPHVEKPHIHTLNDFWLLRLGDEPRWEQLAKSGSPVPAGWTYLDPGRHRLVGFSPDSNTAWALPLTSGEWGKLPGTVMPPLYTVVVYDDRRDRFIGLSPRLDALWTYPLAYSSSWLPIVATGGPPAQRESYQAIYDPIGDRVIVSGGVDNVLGARYAEVWSLSFENLTATEVALVSSDVTSEHVVLSWYGSAAASMAASVERRQEHGDWIEVARVNSDSRGYFSFEDRDIVTGARYVYRLRIGTIGYVSSETPVEIPLISPLALYGARPNPAQKDLLVEFSIPIARPVALALYDVQGRRKIARELGQLEPGRHTVRVGNARDLAPGVYVLRMSFGDQSLSTRVVVTR